MKIALFGGGFDSGNLGVSALTQSAIDAIALRLPEAECIVFDHSCGRSQLPRHDGSEYPHCSRHGGLWTKRAYRTDSLRQIRWCARFGGLWNSAARHVCDAAAILDVSGGDSFTDLYGKWRYNWVMAPKLMALETGVPLVLLPQTYGPYHDPALRAIAARAVRGADVCWARDERSLFVLQELLGAAFDPDRHRCGVDLAFGLQPCNARNVISANLVALLEASREEHPLVGFNVSGLIYNDADKSVSRYRFKADYRAAVSHFLNRLLETTSVNVVLVPHVVTPPDHFESDPAACAAIATPLSERFPNRVLVSPNSLDQGQIKWLIAQTDWFCGTRMHSTIAALSSGVPTATVSYSDKAKGVFETCGQGDHVIDPRELDTQEVIEGLERSFASREAAKVSLAQHVPAVKRQAEEQMDVVAERITAAADKRRNSRVK